MENKGEEEREIGVPKNSMNYNPLESPPPPTTQVKLLPLAPIVSTPQDRRGNTATVSSRRGSSIFSPTQTLNYNHNHNHNHNLPPPPDPDPVHKTTTPTPNFKNSSSPPPPPPPQPPQSAAGETSTTTTTTTTNNNNSISAIRYKECLKNHAASMGGHVVDGCGEFMPSGDEGTPESLRCAACDCHRNFHRKIVQGQYNYNHTNNRSTTTAPLLQGPSLAAPRHHHHHHQQQSVGPTPPTLVNFGGGGAGESSSEDIQIYQSSSAGTGGQHAATQRPPSSSFSGSKKRFRTKFSQEQKERMHDFAEKLGWKMQKQDEQQVQQFCNEVGVKRQVFKVFMHNNKQVKKRQI